MNSLHNPQEKDSEREPCNAILRCMKGRLLFCSEADSGIPAHMRVLGSFGAELSLLRSLAYTLKMQEGRHIG